MNLRERERCLRVLWLVIVVVSATAIQAFGQAEIPGVPGATTNAPPKEAAVAQLRATISAKQAEVKVDLASAEADLAASSDPTPPVLREAVELLRRLDSTLSQEASISDRLEQLELASAKADGDLRRLRTAGVEGDRPYAFLRLEKLRDQKATSETSRTALGAVIKAAVDDLEAARTVRSQFERDSAAIQDSIDKATDANKAELLAQRQLIALRIRVAREVELLKTIDLRANKLAEAVAAKEIEVLGESVSIIAQDVRFSKEGLRAVLTEIEKEELRLRLRQQRLELDRSLVSTLRPGATKEEVELDRAVRDNLSREVVTVATQIERLNRGRQVWQQRYEVSTEAATRADMRSWNTETKTSLEQLERQRSLLQTRREQLDAEINASEERLRTAEPESQAGIRRLIAVLQDRERLSGWTTYH